MIKKIRQKVDFAVFGIMAAISSSAVFAFAEGDKAEELGNTFRNMLYGFLPMLLNVGIALAVIAVAWEGIQLISTSDARAANETKKNLIRIAIGLALLVFARVIVELFVGKITEGM